MRALALCGGRGHPADEVAPTLRRLFAGVAVHDDIESGLRALCDTEHDILVVSALAFTMADPAYDDVRAEHGFALSAQGRTSIAAWLGAGLPLLALHTALVSFDDWPGWGEALGGRWVWGRSHHPPLGEVDVETRDRRFTVVDERYSDLALDDDLDIVATSDGQPVVWRRRAGSAPVVVDILGHDRRSYEVEAHVDLLRDQIAWIEGGCT